MNEELTKKIDEFKQTLDTLPKNNKANLEKYLSVVSDSIKEYSEMKKQVESEIERRKNDVSNKIHENPLLVKEKENLINIFNNVHIFNKYNTAYEKLHLDKILSNMKEEENKSFTNIINTIKEVINIYKTVGLVINIDSFKYSPRVYNFMKIYYQNSDKPREELQPLFEKLYWETPNLITHIELVFKNLYIKNEKLFEKYILTYQAKVKDLYKDDIINVYQKYKKEFDSNNNKDIYLIVNEFLKNNRNVDDYSEEKINSLLDIYVDNITINDPSYEEITPVFEKLYWSIREYKKYLFYSKLITDMKDLYKEKESYKDGYKNKYKEILKEEKVLSKLTKKVYKLEKKNNKADDLYVKIDEEITKLKNLYDELENAKFNERIFKLCDTDILLSLLEIANAYYIYQKEYLRKEDESISLDSISNKINRLQKYIINPYNHLLNNISISEEIDVKEMISNIYNLSKIKLTKNMLDDESNIDKIMEDLEKILINYYISKSDITISEIKFLCEVKEK